MKAHIKEVYTYYGLIRNLLIFEFMFDLLSFVYSKSRQKCWLLLYFYLRR